jgi:hypothetical protein
MNLEFISDNLKHQASIGLPILCFSITDNNLHITTKKVASRFFEHLKDTTTYIEFRVKNKFNCSDEEITNGIEFYDYILEYFESNSIITIEEFFKLLDIKTITDITSESFSDKWNFVIVTRDPTIRLLSGFTELIDSMLIAEDIYDNKEIYDIILSYLKKTESTGEPFGLKYFTVDEANKIINYFSKTSYHIVLTDEHTSNWNTFISYFLTKYKGKFKVIDIDDINDMKIYGKDESDTTNKHIYLNWLEGYSNRHHILDFLSKLNHFLVTDYINYLRIKSLK